MQTMVQQRINTLHRSDMIKHYLYIKGKPFDFTGREYFYPIYDTYNHEILIKSGRQANKSTAIAAYMLTDAISKDFFSNLYVTYSTPQVSDFAIDKLSPLLKYSPELRDEYIDNSIVDRVTEKTFLNGSRISLRSIYRSADTIRGNPCDRIAFDEIQDLLPENIIIAAENLSASPYRYKMYCGTAKTRDNNIEVYYNDSTQNEWMLICPVCGNRNYQDEKIIGKDRYTCLKCGGELFPRKGEWIINNASGAFPGYRLTQLMIPNLGFAAIKDKLRQYPIDKFYNEVLGLPYDLSTRPVTEQELRAICGGRRMNRFVPHLLDGILTIDWASSMIGRAYTVVAIGYWQDGKMQLGYAERILLTDPIAQVDYIIKLAREAKVHVILADYGFGFAQNELLRQKLENDRIGVYPVFYQESSTHIHWKADSRIYTVNRTWSLAMTFNAIKTQQIEFPVYQEMKDLLKDVLAEFTDYRTPAHSEVMYYTHNKNHNDDFLHVLNYLVLGLKMFVTKEVRAES